MSTTKEPPSPFPGPPELPPEPFLLLRPPPSGTLVGLPAPALPPVAPAAVAPLPSVPPVAPVARLRLPLPPARAAAAASPLPLRKPVELARAAPELAQAFDSLRVELVFFRDKWWPGHGPGMIRSRRRQALAVALGIALGLGLGFLGSAAALAGVGALAWPAVAARIAPLSSPPAPGAPR